jgi:hypothetical protein
MLLSASIFATLPAKAIRVIRHKNETSFIIALNIHNFIDLS